MKILLVNFEVLTTLLLKNQVVSFEILCHRMSGFHLREEK
jgi:hypothetical protein